MIQLIHPINLIGPGNEFEQKRTQVLEFQIGRNTVRRILRTHAQRRDGGHDVEISNPSVIGRRSFIQDQDGFSGETL